jgi:hypothetical protein|tara:strand:+ start:1826 stop:2110 length:285 start_codon:yes stop_codon:yes gene_type:complete
MSWLDNLRKRKPGEPINRLLFFSKQELTEQTYAVIRITWFLEGKIAGVSETAIGLYEEDVISEFSDLVGNALRAGCDVSVACIDDPQYLGIYES